MALDPSGTISIDDIVGEFGHTVPDDQMNEYYRDGVLVTDNNTNVPVSGNPIDLEDFYSAERKHVHTITANSTYVVLSSFFTSAEWNENVPKEVIINSGVSVGSTNISTPACRTGTTVGGLALGGSLRLIVNGYIYGAGGAANGGNGGPAMNAEIPMTIENNGRIWAGGGGGGKGGTGGGGWFYPENKAWKYEYAPLGTNNYWIIYSGNNAVQYALANPDVGFTIGGGTMSQYNYGGYTYYKGAYKESWFAAAYYYVLRRVQNVITGGLGGNGARGRGYSQSPLTGSSGASTSTSTGGRGGDGAEWGVAADQGNNGGAVNTSYTTQTIAPTNGASGGQAGHYILNNGNVTWSPLGSVAGRV